MSGVYYNENDPYAAQWLRNLIAGGHLAPGEVDERDIRDVDPADLTGFTQCHFFAGIGIWSAALRRAGWPDDRPVWTGSCPCQPFSAAGKQKGFDDERHLWPTWHNLIRQCAPAIVLGEQVASALAWLDLVSADLEGAGYAFGASDLCAAGFLGAHIRQRLYFVAVADASDTRSQGRSRMSERAGQCAPGESGLDGGMGDSDLRGCDTRIAGNGSGQEGSRGQYWPGNDRSGRAGRLADSHGQDCSGRGIQGSVEGAGTGARPALERSARLRQDRDADAPAIGWHVADWLLCRDGKWRPVEPGTFPLADAPPARVGRLRAYGNGLDLETAAQFCGAVIAAVDDFEVAA